MKVVYIAHPISGDQQRNVQRILHIIYHINMNEENVVPFAPYLPDCMCMDDSNPKHRSRGIKNDIELMNRGFIDELRLYGDNVSAGMMAEIKLAETLNIPVVPMTKATIAYFRTRPHK